MDPAIITTFANVKTLWGKRHELPWDRLFDRLTQPRIAHQKATLPLWAPAIWPNNRRPEGSDPIELYALVLDLDHGATLSGGFGAIQGGFMACLHTSWQHQRDVTVKDRLTQQVRIVREDRFRLVFPFSSPVARARYPVVWRSAERWMREEHGLVIDGQVKNPGRCWYVPGRAPGAPFEAFRNDGRPLDPWELVKRWPTVVQVAQRPVKAPPKSPDYSLQMKRASAYLGKLPESVSGQNGHASLWQAALALVKGFGLSESDACSLLLAEFNPRCDPPWAEREITHKVKGAANSSAPDSFVRSRARSPGLPPGK